MSDIKRKPKPQILFEENRDAFNDLVKRGKCPDLSHQNLSDLDLRGFDFSVANLEGAYMRGANLAGIDLSGANLNGASFKMANISGCLFPATLSAPEIRLSWEAGTRIRQIK